MDIGFTAEHPDGGDGAPPDAKDAGGLTVPLLPTIDETRRRCFGDAAGTASGSRG
jgi:hypothetical protein